MSNVVSTIPAVSLKQPCSISCDKNRHHVSLGDVGYWPLADIGYCGAHVRFRGKADMTIRGMSAFPVAIGPKRTCLVALHMSALSYPSVLQSAHGPAGKDGPAFP